MNRKSIVIIFITVLTGALLSGCVDKAENIVQSTPAGAITSTPVATAAQTAVTSQELEGTISLSGAFALYPMAVRWGEEFQKLHPKVKVDISAGGAGKGMTDTLGG
ncbi:MAG: hypothetical protein J5U19_13805, partial [Candidatus Methanoperedens sp.]|nr:hypothetical protein [Candidatus Methanoperedens sp.]